MNKKHVLQFKVTLINVKPAIWRRIQIDNDSSFWDFHVAIQNAMGWTDSHLHEFSIINPFTKKKDRIGIPDDEYISDCTPLADWEHKVSDYLKLKQNKRFNYTYDFGDDWEHLIEFEGELEKQKIKYPACTGGARACPPEDIGGVYGYENFLQAIKDPNHEEHESYLEWINKDFDPEFFDHKKVKFDNPKERLDFAFGDDE